MKASKILIKLFENHLSNSIRSNILPEFRDLYNIRETLINKTKQYSPLVNKITNFVENKVNIFEKYYH